MLHAIKREARAVTAIPITKEFTVKGYHLWGLGARLLDCQVLEAERRGALQTSAPETLGLSEGGGAGEFSVW